MFATENSGASQTPFVHDAAPVSVTAAERPPGLAPMVRHLPFRQTMIHLEIWMKRLRIRGHILCLAVPNA